MRKIILVGKNTSNISITNFSENLHSSYNEKLLFIFSLLLRKQNLRERFTQSVFYVLEKEKRLFSFPTCFRQKFIDSTQKMKSKFKKCEKKLSTPLNNNGGKFSYFIFTLPILPSKIQTILPPPPVFKI